MKIEGEFTVLEVRLREVEMEMVGGKNQGNAAEESGLKDRLFDSW